MPILSNNSSNSFQSRVLLVCAIMVFLGGSCHSNPKPMNTKVHSNKEEKQDAMKSYNYHDGSNNRYQLLFDRLVYTPVKPAMSSSGVYDGGNAQEKTLSPEQYKNTEKLFLDAIAAKEEQIPHRQMGSGMIRVVEKEGEEAKVYILDMNSEIKDQLEAGLKAVLTP